jgi:hypothetical protein
MSHHQRKAEPGLNKAEALADWLIRTQGRFRSRP